MRHTAMWAVLAVVLVAGCTDEITVNTETTCPEGGDRAGALVGFLVPPDVGLVNASRSGETMEAQIGADGYFLVEDVPPGLYHVVVSPASYSRREFADVMVHPGETTNLRQVAISTMPYPVYRSKPASGEQSVSSHYLTLYVDEPLDLEDLAAGTAVDPPAPGTWRNMEGRAEYAFSAALQVGTSYQVTIDSAVRTEAGVPLGADLLLSFATTPLSVSVTLPQSGPGGGVPLTGFYVRLWFNAPVSLEALRSASSFAPEIQGIWLRDEDYISPSDPTLCERFTFLAYGEPLSPESTYTLTISDETDLVDGVRLPSPSQTTFDTGSHGVIYVSPRNGTGSVSTHSLVRLKFSAVMEMASVESAFSLAELEGDSVLGTFHWDDSCTEMTFSPDEDLHSGGVYRVQVTTEARTASGYNLTEPFESYFSVQ